MENLIDDDLEKTLSDESDSEADNDSNDEAESDDDKIIVNLTNNLLKAKKVY